MKVTQKNICRLLYWFVFASTTTNAATAIDIASIIRLMSRLFANGLGDWGSIPGQVIPKTQKMVLDSAFLNTLHYKVRIKSKVEQSREWNSALPYTLV